MNNVGMPFDEAVKLLMEVGTVSVRENYKAVKYALNEGQAKIVAAHANRYGCNPLEMSNIDVNGEFVTIPPMHLLYDWERRNGGLTKSQPIYEEWTETKTKRNGQTYEVEMVRCTIYGVPHNKMQFFNETRAQDMRMFMEFMQPQEAMTQATMNAFQLHGVCGVGVATKSELGNVKGRDDNFTVLKRATSDLINKAFGQPSPADVAARTMLALKDVRASDYAQIPSEWTLEQKQIAASTQAGHREFLALPPAEQRAQRQRNVALLRGDSDPNEVDPYAEPVVVQSTEPAPEVLQDWLNKLNSLPEVNGFFASVEDLRACINITQFPPINDTFAWKGIKATAIDCASKVNGQANDDLDTSPRSLEHFKAELAMHGIEGDEFEQMVAVYHNDPDTAWDMLGGEAERLNS